MSFSDLNHTQWTFRGNYDEPRLSEIKSLYEELGFSVMLTPFNAECGKGCQLCFKKNSERFTALYTQKM